MLRLRCFYSVVCSGTIPLDQRWGVHDNLTEQGKKRQLYVRKPEEESHDKGGAGGLTIGLTRDDESCKHQRQRAHNGAQCLWSSPKTQ